MTIRIRVGTSGWHYAHWHGPFYPPSMPSSRLLAFYALHFDTVEINASFYRLPSERAVKRWRDTVPPGFCFAAKASRFLTHMKKLKDPEAGLATFLPRIEGLGETLGPILFQLPPNWRCDPGRLAAFLAALPRRHRYSFELRDPSWHTPSVYAILKRWNAAFCFFELAGLRSPPVLTADFTYVRLHGPAGPYQGCYSRAALRAWARRLATWAEDLTHAFVYFDNDEAAFAVQNALELRALIERSTAP